MSVGMEINSLNWLNRSKIWRWSITYASQKFLVKQIGVSVKRFSQIFFLQWENVQIYLSSFWKNWLNFEDLFEWGTRVFPTGGKGLEGWVPLPSVENLLSLLPPTHPHPSPNQPEKNTLPSRLPPSSHQILSRKLFLALNKVWMIKITSPQAPITQ